MWNNLKPSLLYLKCLKVNHKPILFKTGFNEGYAYCNICKKVYRFKIINLCFINEDDWQGSSLPK